MGLEALVLAACSAVAGRLTNEGIWRVEAPGVQGTLHTRIERRDNTIRKLNQEVTVDISTGSMTDEANLGAVIDSALEIAKRRAHALGRIRAALELNDEVKALKLMRIFLGLHDDEESHPTPSGINGTSSCRR